MTTSGTKEWADSNINIQSGCVNNCRYCYAKKMAIRFGRKTEANWQNEEINSEKVRKFYQKRIGRIMFPTSHDITEGNINEILQVLGQLLRKGNQVLLTTKPRLSCIEKICNYVDSFHNDFKSNLQFRFTITSIDPEISKFWEPNASLPSERINALIFAYNHDFLTSVSIEPYLHYPKDIVETINPYITESIWIGIMNKRCVAFNDYSKVANLYSKQFIQKFMDEMRGWNNVRYKDSIQNLMGVDINGRAIV